MALDYTEIIKKIKEGDKRQRINSAVSYQNRIKFHAEIVPTVNYGSGALNDFLSFAASLLPKDKFETFKTLFGYPIKTNEVTEVCFDKLFKVFDGHNPVFNYQFMTTEARDDWEYYRQEILGEPEVWKTKGWENFKLEINSVLIVDLPAEQPAGDRLPSPYFYWLPIDRVISWEEKDGRLLWIAFKQDNDQIAVFDDSYFRVLSDNKGVLSLIKEEPHDLGYCPARFFWEKSLNLKNQILREHPLSKVLSTLDWFLFMQISKQHLDLYGAYPIYSGYAEECDYTDDKGTYCNGGFLCDSSNHYITEGNTLKKCPKCAQKKKIGVGSYVEIPIPDEQSGVPNLKDPISILPADVGTLEYNVTEVTRLRESIINTVVGVDGELLNDQAVNEKQVGAAFENQSAILNRIKLGFESAMTWVSDTICRIRYGNLFISSTISLGSEFYTGSVDELRDRYKKAKENGASESELDNLAIQIIELENRNNPLQLQRMIILRELEPFPNLTREEVIQIHGLGAIDNVEFVLKLNFSSFVRRFERENINIIEFGINLPFSRKIEIINETLKKYAGETGYGRSMGENQTGVQGASGGGTSVPRDPGNEEL